MPTKTKQAGDPRFGNRLRQSREAKSLTIDDLAARIHTSPRALNRWESGGIPKADALALAARILGVTSHWLIFGVERQAKA